MFVLTAIDLWIGRTLFVPPIVKLCQLTRQSQFAVSRAFWFASALDGFYWAEDFFSSVLFGALSLVMMLTASLRADMPNRSMRAFRLLGVAFLALDIAGAAHTGAWGGVEFWLLVLFAEYASTIRTIPPSETRRQTKAARAGSS